MLQKSLLYALAFLARSYDLPSLCYNYHNPETNYQQEFLKPSLVPTVYQLIPRRYFKCVSGVCDFLVSRLMGSESYFAYSTFLPADAVSIENLLIVLAMRGHKILPGILLTHLSTFYAPLLSSEAMYVLSYLHPLYRKDYENSHKSSLSITWFFHLNMFPQYSRYFYDTFYVLMSYLFIIVPKEQKMEIILLFKPSNYKSYLLYVTDSPVFHLYLLIFIIENYVQYLFGVSNVGNPNFLNWSCLAFTSLFILERRWKILARQQLSSKAD